MELVYLWVEDYKNIQNQGFNFSSNFSCIYDKTTKKLAINKKEGLDNFFGENINITAIVGKNGSGKTSILKLILLLIYYTRHKHNKDEVIEYIESKFKDKELFLIIKKDSKFLVISINEISFSCNEYESFKNDFDFFTIYFNYMIDTLYDGYHDLWVNQIYHKSDDYNTPLLVQPNKHENDTLNDVINLGFIEYLTKQKILQFYDKVENTISITNFFKPNYIQIVDNFIDHFRLDSYEAEHVEITITKKIANKISTLIHHKKLAYIKSSLSIPNQMQSIEKDKDFEYMNLLYIAFKVLSSTETLFDKELLDTLLNDITEFIKKDELPSKDYLKSFRFNNIIKIDEADYRVLKLKISMDFDKLEIYKKENFKKLLNNEKIEIIKCMDVLAYIPPWIDIVFFENDKPFESLSNGEKALFTLILDLMYQFQNISCKYDTITFFLDETELGLHPQWQKEYLNNIIESIKPLVVNDKKINIIFATHSPFILSDLPKENVVFLKDGEQVQGVDMKQTFGANIHTLLSDSFFMQGGLIGDFAKNKIENIINYLNDKQSSINNNSEAQVLIDIIGEPIIKNQLQKMLDNKKPTKIEEIDLIKDKIASLTKELDELDNG